MSACEDKGIGSHLTVLAMVARRPSISGAYPLLWCEAFVCPIKMDRVRPFTVTVSHPAVHELTSLRPVLLAPPR